MLRFTLLCLIGLSALARADRILLTSGNAIECTVLAEEDRRVTFRKGVSTFSIPLSQIASIERDRPAAKATAAADMSRLPSLFEVTDALGQQKWATGLIQIPATVIDKGILRNVPYLSHRAATDYEINIYGDPDYPCCVEIGIYHDLLSDPAAKQRCIDFMAAIIGPERAAALAKLKREKDSVTVGEWTIEITPPTDEDAYGGWWVSVYGDRETDKSRASAEEMKAITVARQTASREDMQRREAERNAGETRIAIAAKQAREAEAMGEDWTMTEFGMARTPRASSGVISTGGTVYVRSYVRKDGTFVRGHTRSAPGRGGGRR